MAYATQLVSQPNSKVGYDGKNTDGVRIQIEARGLAPTNNSGQLSAVWKYADKDFDELASVIYDEHFNVLDALLIPHEVVG